MTIIWKYDDVIKVDFSISVGRGGLGEKSIPGVTVRPAHSKHGALPTQCIAHIDQSLAYLEKYPYTLNTVFWMITKKFHHMCFSLGNPYGQSARQWATVLHSEWLLYLPKSKFRTLTGTAPSSVLEILSSLLDTHASLSHNTIAS